MSSPFWTVWLITVPITLLSTGSSVHARFSTPEKISLLGSLAIRPFFHFFKYLLLMPYPVEQFCLFFCRHVFACFCTTLLRSLLSFHHCCSWRVSVWLTVGLKTVRINCSEVHTKVAEADAIFSQHSSESAKYEKTFITWKSSRVILWDHYGQCPAQ